MSDPASTLIYVTYIRTTPQKLWAALTDPAMMRAYWKGMHAESDWRPGSPWRLVFADGRVADAGEILEAEPNRRLVIKWKNQFKPELAEEGWSHCAMELEETNGAVKLTVTHTLEKPQPQSKFISAVSGGWPFVLSNLKSLLETGAVALEAA